MFKLEDYIFDLPKSLIAQRPVQPRDSSRLMVIDRKLGKWEHRSFTDFPDLLDEGQLIVANNSKVMKARLLGQRILPDGSRGGKVEFLMLESPELGVWEGMFHASAKHRPGLIFEIDHPDGGTIRGEILRGASDSPSGTILARFDRDPLEAGAGRVPLPPYIQRNQNSRLSRDLEDYQTVYAQNVGSAAAPTAGLHFTPEILSRIRERRVDWVEMTLHVGLGTFRPVKSRDIRDHHMHEEGYIFSPKVAEQIEAATAASRKILAVGTTAVRGLESAWNPSKGIQTGLQRTSVFLHPGGRPFQVVNQLLTNFHLPGSTLLMLVCAFAGRELVLDAYQDAIREEYRFFSYGDAMLIF